MHYAFMVLFLYPTAYEDPRYTRHCGFSGVLSPSCCHFRSKNPLIFNGFFFLCDRQNYPYAYLMRWKYAYGQFSYKSIVRMRTFKLHTRILHALHDMHYDGMRMMMNSSGNVQHCSMKVFYQLRSDKRHNGDF